MNKQKMSVTALETYRPKRIGPPAVAKVELKEPVKNVPPNKPFNSIWGEIPEGGKNRDWIAWAVLALILAIALLFYSRWLDTFKTEQHKTQDQLMEQLEEAAGIINRQQDIIEAGKPKQKTPGGYFRPGDNII